MKKLLVLAASAAALLLGSFSLPTVAQAQPVITVQFGAPPPPRFERMPPPRRGHVWAPGHWEWRGGRHVWAGGHWMKARKGQHYRAPKWHQQRNGHWEMRRGGWDRDGDGVPNRHDRKPNNPYRH